MNANAHEQGARAAKAVRLVAGLRAVATEQGWSAEELLANARQARGQLHVYTMAAERATRLCGRHVNVPSDLCWDVVCTLLAEGL